MTKKILFTRLIAYILIGLGVPIGFLSWRFNLFDKVTKTSFSVWGLIAIITVISFALALFKQLRNGMKPGIQKQTVDTVCKTTIPLIILTIIFEWMSDFSKEFVQFLVVLIICKTIAGIINPLPQWCLENNIEYKGNILKKIFSFKQKK